MLPSTDFNDEEVVVDRCSILAVLVGKNDIASVSPSYIESIRTEEIIGNGVFGTVFKGTDTNLRRSFGIKAISTDTLCDGNSSDVEKAGEAFQKEIQVRHALFYRASRDESAVQLTKSLSLVKRYFRSFVIQTLSHCTHILFRTMPGAIPILFMSSLRKDPWIAFGRLTWAPSAFRCSVAAFR